MHGFVSILIHARTHCNALRFKLISWFAKSFYALLKAVRYIVSSFALKTIAEIVQRIPHRRGLLVVVHILRRLPEKRWQHNNSFDPN